MGIDFDDIIHEGLLAFFMAGIIVGDLAL